MKLYISLDDDSKIVQISNISIPSTCDAEVFSDDPIDFDLIDGYKIIQQSGSDKVMLAFDRAMYKEAQAKKEAEAKKIAAQIMLQELTKQAALSMATDDQAVVMSDMYPEWESNKSYEAGDRLRYQGGFYKVVQAHTAQPDWTPDSEPALFVCLSDPEEEWPEFVQPTGAHDTYMAGDKVTFKGTHYTCQMDNTAHTPEEMPIAWTAEGGK